ncbi:MAG: YceI family protein [Candidatus Promineifilaceae bacterium]
MKKLTAVTILLFILLLSSGCFAISEPEESSGAVEAPTLPAAVTEAPPTVEATPQVDEAYPAGESASGDAYPVEEAPVVPDVQQTDDAYPAEEAADAPPVVEPPQDYPAAEEADPADEAVEADPAAESAGDLPIYEIDPAQSEARFTINEVLRGAPTTVVGRSSNLGGQIALDLANPSTAQVGTILINARDFLTDNEFRNRAISNEILLTNDYEYITFEPTAVRGLPETAEIGQTYDLQITGILGITDATREVTFDARVTPLSESEIAGLASVEIRYADFGLTIPFSQSVESVEDNLLLELDFVANAVE